MKRLLFHVPDETPGKKVFMMWMSKYESHHLVQSFKDSIVDKALSAIIGGGLNNQLFIFLKWEQTKQWFPNR